eukprot:Em0006g785a
MTETIFLEKQSPGYEETSGNDQADHSEERRIPTFEVDAVILRSLMRMQTGFEMKTLARTAEKGANNLLHSISLNSSFVAALEEQLNNLLDFTRRHVAEVRTRLKLSVATKEELYHLGDVLLSLQSTLIRGLQDLRDLADVFDNLNGNSNAASDFLQSLDVLEKRIAWRTISPYLVVTYAYLLGLSMLGWAKARIDYVHEHLLPMGTVTPSHVFSTAGALTVLFGALMFLFLVLSAFIESVGLLVFFAFIKWLLLAVFLFNPLDVLNRGARFFFVKHTSQVILSPLFPVLFSHVWYTDQLLSLVAVGLDLQYQICYFIVGSWFPGTPLGTCSSSATAIRPLIASLPAMWRILQSLRCFVETRSPRHIVNSVKYITTVAVVLVSAAIELTQSSTLSIGQLLNPLLSGWVAVWGVVAAINILYSHTWDVVMDWEVVRFNSNRVPHIRRQRLYKAMLFTTLRSGQICYSGWPRH